MARTLHFFWVGGPINATSEQTIKKWAAFLAKVKAETGESFQIAVWQDPVGSSAASIQTTQERLADVKRVNIQYRSISELEELKPDMYQIIRYEIDKLNANYSAASDVFRYTVLAEEGGMYLDTDVNPPEHVDDFIEAWQQHNTLITECSSKDSPISNSDLLIAPEPGLPILYDIIEDIFENYHIHSEPPVSTVTLFNIMNSYRYSIASKLIMQTYTARDQNTIYAQAMKKAGPDLLKENIFTETADGWIELVEAAQSRQSGSLRTPLAVDGTAGSWLGRATTFHDDEFKVLTKLSHSIDFELTHVGILRTDDHIQSAIEAMGYESPQDDEKIKVLIEKVIVLIDEKLQSEARRSLVECCQLTFKFPETQVLYAKHHLLRETGLTPFTPDMELPRLVNKIYQPFATQHQLFPDEQKARVKTSNLSHVYASLAQAKLTFHVELLRFYQMQYHERILDGLIKFSTEEMDQYLSVLENISLMDAPQEIQDLKMQLISEARITQSQEQNLSRVQYVRFGVTSLRWAHATDRQITQKLAEKITKLEHISNRTPQQNMKLYLLKTVQNDQIDNLLATKQTLSDNEARIINMIGVETFVLANAILDRRIQAQQDIQRLDDNRPNL